MRQAYRAILLLYPAEYRAAFAPEMIETFQQASIDHRKRGTAAVVYFAVRESAGLLRGLFREWFEKSTARSSYITSRSWPELSDAPDDGATTDDRVQRCIRCLERAIANHDFQKARFYSAALDRLRS